MKALLPNTDGDDHCFGEGMGLSGDGSTLVVGAWQEDGAARGVNGDQTSNGASTGAAYVYVSFSTDLLRHERFVVNIAPAASW